MARPIVRGDGVSAMSTLANASSRSSSSRAVGAPSVAIVGATGAVGAEFLRVLEQRNFPFSSLKLLASSRSAGKTQVFKGKPYTIEELTESSFKGVDIALFSAGGSISKKFGPIARDAGSIGVDNSSAFPLPP